LNPQFANYVEVLFGSVRFPQPDDPRLINSTIISFSSTLLSLFLGGLGGLLSGPHPLDLCPSLVCTGGIALYLPYQAVIIPW